jgi:hypothetical protein
MSKTVERSNMTQTDSKGKVTREPKNLAETNVNFRWWVLDEKEMAPAIAATILFIKQHQGSRIEQLTVSTRLYGHTSMYNLIGTAFTRASAANNSPMSQRISYNLCSSVVETLEAKMAKNKVIPTFITNGADWKVQKKAKQLTKFCGGLFYQQNVHRKSIISWNDAGVWGDGFVQVYENDDKVCIDRVLPHELFVDTIESLTSEPRQLHRVRLMDRDIALQVLPELEEEIKTVSPANYQEIGGQGTAVDIIQVTESWHLKSGPLAKDGVHVFCVGDGALAEDYDKDYFPFPHLRYVNRKLGWNGQGACERLMAIQGEINRCMMLKQRALWMQSAFKILVENGSKVVSQHLDNEVGTVIHYSGVAPQYITPPATNPELDAWIDKLRDWGYQQEGANQLNSSGEVPMSVKSGKAMRTLNQITDDRFIFMQQNMEDFCLEIAKQAINVVKDIYSRVGKYEVVFPDTRFVETIDWADVQLDEEQYVLKAYPTSSLSDDLTGRLAEVQELTQSGMITPRSSRRLMDMPDVEMADSLANSAEDRITQIFENMLEKGEVTRFEPGFHDAELAVQLGIKYINYAQYYNCPDDKIQLVRDYIAQVNAEALSKIPGIIAQEAQTDGQGAEQAQGVPQAAPEPPPVNNLIQNVPGVLQ